VSLIAACYDVGVFQERLGANLGRGTAGAIHLFFEGYFSLNHTRMGPAQDIFGQLWKEYAFSDSRYLTSDPFVLCMETVTAVCSSCPNS
jgi:hypothetical protein